MKAELEKIHQAQAAKEYPDIDLEKGEHVVLCMERSKIGLAGIWIGVGLIILVVCIALISFSAQGFIDNTIFANTSAQEQMKRGLYVGIFALFILLILAGLAGHFIYKSNRMYITNMRAIQKVRTSLFSNSTNIIDLKRIEDVSYKQSSLLEHIFHFGTLRMSTVGEETTYTFSFLDTPHDEVKTISHLIQNRKDAGK